MAYLHFFPESLTALREELMQNHIDLLAKIDMTAGLERSLGEIGALLDPPVMFDGNYALDKVCEQLLVELKKRSNLNLTPKIILPVGMKVN